MTKVMTGRLRVNQMICLTLFHYNGRFIFILKTEQGNFTMRRNTVPCYHPKVKTGKGYWKFDYDWSIYQQMRYHVIHFRF